MLFRRVKRDKRFLVILVAGMATAVIVVVLRERELNERFAASTQNLGADGTSRAPEGYDPRVDLSRL